MKTTTLTAAALATFLLLGCDAPAVFATSDVRQNTNYGRIDGTVVVSSAARGNVVVLLYDAAKPPPPAGTGRPLTFAVVPQAAVFGDAAEGDLGPFTAPFTFSLVGAGNYLIRGFIDANADFVPWYGVTGEVNAGDVGGGYVDAVTRAPKVIVMPVDDHGAPQAVNDVPVSFSDAARVSVDRPVFEVAGGQTSITLTGMPTVLDLVNRAIDTALVQQRRPVFLARLVDDNGDGAPDVGADGRPLFWPRVVVRKMADGDNPVADETTADYEHVNPMTGDTIAADGVPDTVVLAAGFDFTALAPQLVDAMGAVKQAPTPVNRLPLVIQPRAFDASNPAAPAVLKTVPPGRYAITIIQTLTGQTWRVPNELAPGAAEARGLPAIESQGLVLTVQ